MIVEKITINVREDGEIGAVGAKLCLTAAAAYAEKHGLVSASRDELMAIWIFDDDLFRLFDFSKFVLWCKITGVKVNGT